MKHAVAYFRTSSATNVGEDKDTLKRQRKAVEQYAKDNSFEIVDEYYDAAVSGADRVETRAGFAEMLDRIERNGVRVVLVEHQDRFARDMEPAVLGMMLMKAREVTVLDASGNDLTNPKDPMQKAMMQIGFVFSELEKTRLVQKLRGARERKRAKTGKCEGRRSLAETRPDMVKEAKRLARKNPRTGKKRSLRKISAELVTLGFTRENGSGYSSTTIRNVINR
jgi:DNA invertase Pin-like site-specific DNA recombinase